MYIESIKQLSDSFSLEFSIDAHSGIMFTQTFIIKLKRSIASFS